MAEADRLVTLGNELLDGVVAIVAAAGLEAFDPAMLVHGEAADDCGQLIVRLTQSYIGTTDSETQALRGPGGFGLVAEWEVRSLRCVHTIDAKAGPPTATEQQEDAEVLLQDGWAIYKGLVDAILAGDVLSTCQQTVITALAPVGPEGGIGGWTFTVRAQL